MSDLSRRMQEAARSRPRPVREAGSGGPVRVRVPGNHLMPALVGEHDELLREVEFLVDANVLVRGNEIDITGPEADIAGALFEELVLLVEQGNQVEPANLRRYLDMIKGGERPSDLAAAELRMPSGLRVRPRTSGQKAYLATVRTNVITFGLGPAGTGKSWLAVAMAVQALLNKEVNRIVLTRPAVEAGERLGFLPGDMMAKIDPYLRPLYDALYDFLTVEGAQKLLERNAIEVAPIAYMRGRTLNDSFIIVDEAQNTTPAQMKMILTRLGFGSRMVVTGDPQQVDMPEGRGAMEGLQRVLGGIDGLAFVNLTSRDVVRHAIVSQIVDAYDAFATSSR